MRESLKSYCERNGMEYILEEWDAEKNDPLTPDDVSYGSKKEVWWKCTNGHVWLAKVYSRTGGSRCPYCQHRIPIKGVNDFASEHPELAQEWHPTLNGNLKPDQFFSGSHQRVWWQCAYGHIWQAEIKTRALGGHGCPVCNHKKIVPSINDLATYYPEIAKEWHPSKNGNLRPDQVSAGSSRRVWWKCKKGHEWQASIVSRTRTNNGCPYCGGKKVLPGFNDLESQYPEIAKEWHPSKNGVLTPKDVTPFSNRNVWWRCEKEHDYLAVVAARVGRHTGCPYCSNRRVLPGYNDLATTNQTVAKQWHPTLNGSLTPQDVTAGSRKQVWWQCEEGHVWQAVVYSRTSSRPTGCPICAGRGNRHKNR